MEACADPEIFVRGGPTLTTLFSLMRGGGMNLPLKAVHVFPIVDINECQGEGGGNTCHPTTHCVNTDGGYKCICQDEKRCIKSKSLSLSLSLSLCLSLLSLSTSTRIMWLS